MLTSALSAQGSSRRPAAYTYARFYHVKYDSVPKGFAEQVVVRADLRLWEFLRIANGDVPHRG